MPSVDDILGPPPASSPQAKPSVDSILGAKESSSDKYPHQGEGKPPFFSLENLKFALMPDFSSFKPPAGLNFVPGETIGQTLKRNPQAAEQAMNVAMSFGPGNLGKAGIVKPSAQELAESKSKDIISKQFAKGVKEGAPPASDVIAEMARARTEGQPLTLSDITNHPIGSLAGSVYRQGGGAASIMKGFMEKRGKEAVARTEALIRRHLSDDSYFATVKSAIADRSMRARPLWDEAMAGGSLAPLQHQFEQAWNDLGKEEAEAQKEVLSANSRLTQARASQSQAGNVYSSSGSNRAFGEARRQSEAAIARLRAIQGQRSDALDRLRRAQEDGSANAPGAIWSPRIQEFLDTKEVQRGIRRGYDIEKREAVGEGKKFNPYEYAIVGVDKEGNPIVGQVPNMKLLAVAKEGLDAIIESPKMKNPLTGVPTKDGRSYIKFRNGLVEELDRLNPEYRQARDVWAGDTALIKALDDGKNFLNDKRFSPEELAEHVAGMTSSEKESFTIGVADALKSKLFKGADTEAGTRGVINTEDARMRLRPLFGSDEAAQDFIDAMDRERKMTRTSSRIYGGSPTAEREAADKTNEAMLSAAHGIMRLLEGRWLSAIASGLRARRLFGGKQSPELSEAIARALVDPDIKLNSVGALLPAATPRPRIASPSGQARPNLEFRAAPTALAPNDDRMRRTADQILGGQ